MIAAKTRAWGDGQPGEDWIEVNLGPDCKSLKINVFGRQPVFFYQLMSLRSQENTFLLFEENLQKTFCECLFDVLPEAPFICLP